MSRHLIISVDGFDGSGKSTLINSIVSRIGNTAKIKIDRLIPNTSKVLNDIEYIDKIIPSKDLELSAYTWEAFTKLSLQNVLYCNFDYVFFDRWLFSFYGRVGYFDQHLEFYENIIRRIRANILKMKYIICMIYLITDINI